MENTADMIKVSRTDEEILVLNSEEIKKLWHQQTRYLHFLEQLSSASEEDAKRCELSVEKAIKQAQAELSDVKSGVHQLSTEETNVVPPSDTKGTLADPCVNLLVQKLRSDLREREKRIDNVTAELNAWQLTSSDGSSVDEKRAMARCRMLANENSELGDQVSESRLSHFRALVDEQRGVIEEVRQDIDVCESVTAELDSDLSTLQGTIMQLYQALRTKGKASSDLVACLEYNRHSASQTSSSSTANPSRSKSSSKSKTSASKTPTSAQKSSTPLSSDAAHSSKNSTISNGKHVQDSSKKNSTGDSVSVRAENGPVSKKAKTMSGSEKSSKKERESNQSDSTDFRPDTTSNGVPDNNLVDDLSCIKTEEIDANGEAMETSVFDETKLNDVNNTKLNGVKQRTLPVEKCSVNFTTQDGSNLEQISNCV